MRSFIVSVLVLLCGFSVPLFQVVQLSRQNGLYSYIVLIPFVSLFLIWQQRDRLDGSPGPGCRGLAWLFLSAGLGFLAWYLLLLFDPGAVPEQNVLALAMYALVLLIAGAACLFLNRKTLGVLGFPLGFLIFLAPFPVFVETALEHLLQRGSAVAAHALFQVVGTPVLRTGTFFRLPGFSLEVAPECSGINSTVALLVTSLVAGQIFIRSPWKRAILALLVVPIALLRNGLRVFTIGELCVHVGPEMIDSYIHHHGGPIFFALSLVPFSLILFFLVRSERLRRPARQSAT